MITGEEALHLARKELGKIKDAIKSLLTSEQTARELADAALQSAINSIQTLTASLSTKLNGITPFDTSPTSNSTKGVTSGGVYSALSPYVATYDGYTGATDIDTVKDYAVNLARQHGYNKFFAFRVNPDRTSAQGYFGTSSFNVLCCFSSTQYGFGLMLSDSPKSIATFYLSGGTVYTVELGDFVHKVATGITNLTGLTTSSKLFVCTTNISVGSTGITLPAYSRGVYINYVSMDGALIAIDPSANLYVAFKNNGTWSKARKI